MITKWEIYLIALIALILAFVGAEFHGRHIGRQEQRDEFAAAAVKQADESRAREQAARDKLLSVSTNYEQKISQLRVDIASKPSSVRVCNKPAATVSEATATPGGPVSAGPAQLGGENGPDHQRDIGPDLDAYKRDAQALALRCAAVIAAWPR